MGELGRCASTVDPANIVVVSCFAPIKLPSRIATQLRHPTRGYSYAQNARLQESFDYSPFPTDRFQFYPISSSSTHFTSVPVMSETPAAARARLLESRVFLSVQDPESHFTAQFQVPPIRLRDLVY